MDDKEVRPVPKEQVLGSNAYMLVYQRRQLRPMLLGREPELAANAQPVVQPCVELDTFRNLWKEELVVKVPSIQKSESAEAASLPVGAQPAVDTGVRVSCANDCGFFGDPAMQNYCSQCFALKFPCEASKRKAEADERNKLQVEEGRRQRSIAQLVSLRKTHLNCPPK